MIPYHSHSNTPPRIISCKNFYLVPKRASTTSPTPPATTAGTHHLSTIHRKYDCTRNPCRDDYPGLGVGRYPGSAAPRNPIFYHLSL